MIRCVIIAHFTDGSAAYLSSTNNSEFTQHKRWAWKVSPEQAEETVSRLHGVMASWKGEGGWKGRGVSYFRWAVMKNQKSV